MIKKSVVVLLIILFSIFAVPHGAKADGIGEAVLIGTGIVVVIGLVSILISSPTEASRTLNGMDKNKRYAERNIIHSGMKNYSVAEYRTKADRSEHPYALNITF